MRNYFVLLLGMLSFFLLIYFTIIGIETPQNRRFLYYYPNGFIANADWNNHHTIGLNINDHSRIPPIKNFRNQTQGIQFEFSSKWNAIMDFIPHLSTSLLYILIATWFLFRDNDFFLFLFFFDIAILIFSDFILLAFDDFYFPFYFTLFMLFFLMIHLGLRFKGKDISTRWLLPEIFFSAIFGFIGYTEKAETIIFIKLVNIAVHFLLIASIGSMIVILYDLLKYKTEKDVVLKRLSLLFSIFIVFVFPYLIYGFDLFTIFPYSKTILTINLLIFPLFFLYGTFRYALIPEQFLFSSSVILLYLTLITITSYSMYIGFFKYLLPIVYIKHKALVNFLFIIILLSILSIIKHKTSELIEYWTFGRNKKLNKYLKEMTELIASPISMKATMNTLAKKIQEALEINKITILVPGDDFPDNIDFRSVNIIKIHSNSEIWKFFVSKKEAIITSYLAFGVGVRESTYNFLRNLEIQLAFTISGYVGNRRISAVFLVGEKINKTNFSLGELRFIKECTRLSTLLLQNYQLLVAEVEKKKLVRDLNTVQIVDRTINPSHSDKLDTIELGYLSIPAVGISGDYIDFIKLSDTRLLFFLGDVSGHGLGTGYLVSALKSIVRSLVRQGMDLPKIFQSLNEFLIDRYKGNEFMSLIGGIYDSNLRTFDYINAGHLPILVLNSHGNIVKEDITERLLGIFPSEYTINSIQLNTDQKLIMYSDGITETFDPSETIYGLERLKDFLIKNIHAPIKEIPILLEQELNEFRKDGDITDDMSFIIFSTSRSYKDAK